MTNPEAILNMQRSFQLGAPPHYCVWTRGWLSTFCFVAFSPHTYICISYTEHMEIILVTSISQLMLTVPGLWTCWPSLSGNALYVVGWHEHFYMGLVLSWPHTHSDPLSYPRTMEFSPGNSTLLPGRSVAAALARPDLQAHPLTRGHGSRIYLPIQLCRNTLSGPSFFCCDATTSLCSHASPHTCASMCFPFLSRTCTERLARAMVQAGLEKAAQQGCLWADGSRSP